MAGNKWARYARKLRDTYNIPYTGALDVVRRLLSDAAFTARFEAAAQGQNSEREHLFAEMARPTVDELFHRDDNQGREP